MLHKLHHEIFPAWVLIEIVPTTFSSNFSLYFPTPRLFKLRVWTIFCFNTNLLCHDSVFMKSSLLGRQSEQHWISCRVSWPRVIALSHWAGGLSCQAFSAAASSFTPGIRLWAPFLHSSPSAHCNVFLQLPREALFFFRQQKTNHTPKNCPTNHQTLPHDKRQLHVSLPCRIINMCFPKITWLFLLPLRPWPRFKGDGIRIRRHLVVRLQNATN